MRKILVILTCITIFPYISYSFTCPSPRELARLLNTEGSYQFLTNYDSNSIPRFKMLGRTVIQHQNQSYLVESLSSIFPYGESSKIKFTKSDNNIAEDCYIINGEKIISEAMEELCTAGANIVSKYILVSDSTIDGYCSYHIHLQIFGRHLPEAIGGYENQIILRKIPEDMLYYSKVKQLIYDKLPDLIATTLLNYTEDAKQSTRDIIYNSAISSHDIASTIDRYGDLTHFTEAHGADDGGGNEDPYSLNEIANITANYVV